MKEKEPLENEARKHPKAGPVHFSFIFVNQP